MHLSFLHEAKFTVTHCPSGPNLYSITEFCVFLMETFHRAAVFGMGCVSVMCVDLERKIKIKSLSFLKL